MKRNTDETVTRAAIIKAMRLQRPVTVTYVKADGTETVRTIEPFLITTNKAGDWYVRAMDRQSGEARSWRLDRIRFYSVGGSRSRFVLPAYVSATQPPVTEPQAPAEPEPVTVLVDGPDGEDVGPVFPPVGSRETIRLGRVTVIGGSLWDGEDVRMHRTRCTV